MGKINFYYKFMEDACKLLEPLHNLLRKNVKFICNEECEKSFQRIKEHLCSSPALATYEQNKEIFIYTDANGDGLGAVLKQPQDNEMFMRSGKKHHAKYSTCIGDGDSETHKDIRRHCCLKERICWSCIETNRHKAKGRQIMLNKLFSDNYNSVFTKSGISNLRRTDTIIHKCPGNSEEYNPCMF
ncbi:uncharacterized protein LOC105681294 [Bombus impatiens]|uniref:Uncharacterized protein LOC105681294 n=1 Tax=Bombus impatiens TaxID=132113 RepID=A0A6P3V136_BOMIM|nr:uncharacterized protein LOC105681294 [Bombus impatiens]